MPNFTQIKDDWPQSLVMSMGTLFLLVGVSLEIIRFLDTRSESVRENCATSLASFGAAHPGLLTLVFGAAFTLIGYFLPMKRAK